MQYEKCDVINYLFTGYVFVFCRVGKNIQWKLIRGVCRYWIDVYVALLWWMIVAL